MKAKRFSEEQIIAVLNEAEAGPKTKDLCRRHGISDATGAAESLRYAQWEIVGPPEICSGAGAASNLRKWLPSQPQPQRDLSDSSTALSFVAKSPTSSNELFHLVGRLSPTNDEKNYGVLVKILRDGFVTHPPHVPEWGPIRLTLDLSKSLRSGAMLVPEIVCLCDISFDHLALHVEKYGRFGLSIDKSYAIKRGARPVSYFQHIAETALACMVQPS